mgnify:CR=1 FL=1
MDSNDDEDEQEDEDEQGDTMDTVGNDEVFVFRREFRCNRRGFRLSGVAKVEIFESGETKFRACDSSLDSSSL